MLIDEGTVSRVAGELMISQEQRWAVREARAVTVRALATMSSALPDRVFHPLVQAVYRVGCVVEQVAELDKSLLWDIEEIQRDVDTAVSSWLEPEPRKPFVDAIAAHIKNKEPFRPRILDWTPEINRFLRHTSTEDFFPDLLSKLSLALRLDAIIEARREALILHAAEVLDVRVESLATVLREEMDAARARADSRRQQEQVASRRVQVGTEESGESAARALDALVELAEFVHQRKRASFLEWMTMLTPRAREAVGHRIAMLTIEPLVHRLWVKSILGTHRANLRELRVIADDTHYRVLFVGTPDERPLILSFGLRRDLADLIIEANRV